MDSSKYQGRYRIPSARHPVWDYATPAAYFITICTRDRHPYFGHLRNGTMTHSAMGQIAWDVWHLIPAQFDHCRLDAFVVMPNHIHGVLVLVAHFDHAGRDAINRVSTPPPIAPTPPPIGGVAGKHNPLLGKSVSRIIRWYKGRCTHTMRKIRPDFTWQPRFHDRIIRNDKELTAIRRYICNNAIHHS